MKKITKRIFSAILGAIMLILALPLTGFADNKIIVNYGDIIEYGSYPQTLVKDVELIKNLDKITKGWKSYNYYSGSGEYDYDERGVNSMAQGNWMNYADFTYGGNKYRAVTFSQYRPYRTTIASSEKNSYQDDNGYYINNVYYFLFEPIKWRVICNGSEESIACVSELILDSQAMQNKFYRQKSGTPGYDGWTMEIYYSEDFGSKKGDSSKYANNYENSSLKTWLKTNFLSTAISTDRSKLENIDIMSYKYTFATDEYTRFENKAERRAVGTDYAKAQGLRVDRNSSTTYKNNSEWWLSDDYTGYHGSSDYTVYGRENQTVAIEGGSSIEASNSTCCGVRPIIELNNIELMKKGVVSVGTTAPIRDGDKKTNINVVVYGSPTKIRLKKSNEYTWTCDRNSTCINSITTNPDGTETWNFDFRVQLSYEEFKVQLKYAKTPYNSIHSESGWFFGKTLKLSKELNKTVYSYSIDESYDDVMYAGMHKVTVETGVDATKVQFYKDGNTWTYSADNASYVIEDDKKIWSINMNFSQLGEDMEYYIRTRSRKSAFEFSDVVMNVWVRFK